MGQSMLTGSLLRGDLSVRWSLLRTVFTRRDGLSQSAHSGLHQRGSSRSMLSKATKGAPEWTCRYKWYLTVVSWCVLSDLTLWFLLIHCPLVILLKRVKIEERFLSGEKESPWERGGQRKAPDLKGQGFCLLGKQTSTDVSAQQAEAVWRLWGQTLGLPRWR